LIYVKEKDGEYYLASERWARLYEGGALGDKPPAAAFRERQDAIDFDGFKNRTRRPDAAGPAGNPPPCRADCRYYNGSLNETKCDVCIRKGNLFDHYEKSLRKRS